jgi:MYXO-CTERM domain-containing protein
MRALFFLGLLVSAPAFAIVGGHPPAEDDQRFDAVGAWSRAAWLGLGESPSSDHNWYGGATLIRANLVVTAKHLIDNEAVASGVYAVRFRRRIDGGLGSREQGVFSYHHALVDRVVFGPGDRALAYLVEPVTHIQPIAVMQIGFRGLDGADHIHAGWGQEGPGAAEGPRNQLLLCDENQLTRVSLNSVTYPSLTGADTPPCAVNRWDSGGAVLVEEQGRLWLLASHHTYSSGPTMAAWLDFEASRQSLHTPFGEADLAIEEMSLSESQVFRGERLMLNVQVSNPAGRRRGMQAPELIAELSSSSLPDGSQIVGRVSLDTNWNARQRRQLEMPLNFPENLPISLYQLTLRLQVNGADALERNNLLGETLPITVKARRPPLSELRTAMIVRPDSEGRADVVHLIHAERRNGIQVLWLFARSADGTQSFSQVLHSPSNERLVLETPWGEFGYDPQDELQTTVIPAGFLGRFVTTPAGSYSSFSGLYHGDTEIREPILVALTSAGQMIGGIAKGDGSALLINHAFMDSLLSVEGGGQSEAGLTGMDVEWLAMRDYPRLDLQRAEGGRFRLHREEEPLGAYEPCRNDWSCLAGRSEPRSACYIADDQPLGLCTASPCNNDEQICDEGSSCFAPLNRCAPRCESDEICPSAMTCTFMGICVDCSAFPEACQAPDAGPAPDTGASPDAAWSDAQSVDASAFDAGSSEDAGGATPKPGSGCSCQGGSPSALLWPLMLFLLWRRQSKHSDGWLKLDYHAHR